MELTTEEKSRAINYAKAIAIILMVASHYSGAPLNKLVPYMYHMPFFFFLGGMLFNHEKTLINHYKKVLTKHFLYIIFAYIATGIIALLINHFVNSPVGKIFEKSISDTIILTIKSGFSNNRYFLASWFLFAYMIIMIFAPFVCRAIARSPIPSAIGICIALAFGWIGVNETAPMFYATKNIAYNYATQAFVGGMFFIFGFSLKNIIFSSLNNVIFSTIIITTIILYGEGLIFGIGMSWSLYKPGLMFSICGSVFGIYAIFYISSILSKASHFRILERVGIESKSIMAYHLIAFSLLNIVAWKLYGFEISKRDILHSYYNAWSWIPYIILGVFLPIVLSKVFCMATKIPPSLLKGSSKN
ncbi:hypothetical protein FEM41_14965 [Jejubacter calystegiae]|uniref:Acyltransferase 3 domain-containing protein n=1 Tax=Jejubacter calystegiae TaxID=2579935 RepID=A0A4P8YL12_9ENTR|nr:acyltransferase family protein [Jejubacter calystegiae]QCT20853.1 hypothetical protein FEM41_14965 [Jejubacter calystegiae]